MKLIFCSQISLSANGISDWPQHSISAPHGEERSKQQKRWSSTVWRGLNALQKEDEINSLAFLAWMAQTEPRTSVLIPPCTERGVYLKEITNKKSALCFTRYSMQGLDETSKRVNSHTAYTGNCIYHSYKYLFPCANEGKMKYLLSHYVRL